MSALSASQWTTLLGSTLENHGGSIGTTEALSDKVVGLYFSAHWCGPCRGFTPKLAEFYSNMKKAGKEFEIVFVSSDRDEESFKSYFAEMPWLALPYSERDLKASLSKKFKVQGIPTFVILNTDGTTITTNGRSKVDSDRSGEQFPWVPKSLTEEIGTSFLSDKTGTVVVTNGHFQGKFLGLYFSAHWCGPCRGFTPQLVKFYNSRRESGKDDFEVIFCSSDEDTSSFQEYFGEMPWLSIPFGDKRIQALSDRFDVEGIPSLVIIDPEGNVVTKGATSNLRGDPTGAKFPFYPEPIEDLSKTVESYGVDINSAPAVILFMEGCDDAEQEEGRTALLPFARDLAEAKAKSTGEPEFLFFTAFGGGGIADRVRQLTQLGAASAATTAQMVILDIPDQGGFYVSADTEVTTESIGRFIEGYKAKTLERKQLQR